MGKTQSKHKITTTKPAVNKDDDGNDAGENKNEPKDLIISFNSDFTQVDVKKEKRVFIIKLFCFG